MKERSQRPSPLKRRVSFDGVCIDDPNYSTVLREQIRVGGSCGKLESLMRPAGASRQYTVGGKPVSGDVFHLIEDALLEFYALQDKHAYLAAVHAHCGGTPWVEQGVR